MTKFKELLFALLLLTNSSNLLEMWPRGVGTAEYKDHANCGRKRLTNVFASEATLLEEAVVTLYMFFMLKMDTAHNLHLKMLPVDSFQRRDVCNWRVSQIPRCH